MAVPWNDTDWASALSVTLLCASSLALPTSMSPKSFFLHAERGEGHRSPANLCGDFPFPSGDERAHSDARRVALRAHVALSGATSISIERAEWRTCKLPGPMFNFCSPWVKRTTRLLASMGAPSTRCSAPAAAT